MKMIKVENLIKSYGKNEVLKGISFSVSKNEIFGLLGPNGAGKTTTMECMEGLRGFNSGNISIMGLNPDEAAKQKLIGIQLQSSSLPSNISVKDAMDLFCVWNNADSRYDLLEKFGLKNMSKKQYKTMSTGQKRRLHLALALACEPRIIFLDEPTAGLDVEARVALHQEIKNLKKKGATILLASHDMAEVEALCDRVAIIVNGKIKKIGSPSEIVSDVRRETLIKIKLSVMLKDLKLDQIELKDFKEGYYHFSTTNLLDGLSELLSCLKEDEIEILDLTVDKPTLEERFIEIAREGK
jgi:ABC-2 type transport system ATP-binding protein